MAGGRRAGNAIFVDGDEFEAPDEPAAALALAAQRGGWAWIELDPGDTAIRQLGRVGVPAIELGDLSEGRQSTRFARYGTEIVVVVHSATYADDGDRVVLAESTILLGTDHVVCVRESEAAAFDAARERLRNAPRLARLGPAAGAYAILDAVVDAYQPVVDRLEVAFDEIDEALDHPDDELARRVFRLTREVSRFLVAVSPLEAVIDRLRTSIAGDDPSALVSRDERSETRAPVGGATSRPDHLEALLADVRGHVVRIETRLGELRSTLDGALSLISTLASQRATDLGLVQAERSKKISAWAAVFAVPTIVSGIYGMNFQHMPELAWTWGYPASWAVMIGLSVTLVVLFKRNDWL